MIDQSSEPSIACVGDQDPERTCSSPGATWQSIAFGDDWAYNRGRRRSSVMPLSDPLRKFLDSHQVKYAISSHHTAFTAREVAAAEHLPAREVAKVVVVFGDSKYHLIVIPANRLVDFQEVCHTLGLSQARLATEDEL